MKKLTTEEFIERARKIHGNKYDYSKVNYVNAKTKVCIICTIVISRAGSITNEKNGEERLNASIVNLNIEKIRLIK